MTVGWCSRTIRAAVFAAVCVLLATLGHVLMSDTALPWWALAAAAVVTSGTALCLAGRERGLPLVLSVAVTVQAALHVWFSYAQELSTPSMPPMPSMPMDTMAMNGMGDGTPFKDYMVAMAHMGHAMDHMAQVDSSMEPLSAPHSMTGTGHVMGGMSTTGMLAAHLLAALMCGLWLAYGERAAFRILRAVAGWLAAPLRLPLTLPAPPHRPNIHVRRSRSARTPRRLLVAHAITSRGPPVGTAVV
ncbi:hypothetical protein ACFCYB_11695 [Streptomyces sp. NPDC056309]|uniref:hypothetical protein n=1 Tax=unclassified Streptomyces TaxID=2593676 RepID=UPI0035E2FD1F